MHLLSGSAWLPNFLKPNRPGRDGLQAAGVLMMNEGLQVFPRAEWFTCSDAGLQGWLPSC